jgi:hypothetical protein
MDVVNIDNGVTWKRVTGIAASGNGSVLLANYESNTKSRDELRLPQISIPQVDSAFLSFKVAATTASAYSVRSTVPDTLEVLVSTDCGATYSSLYKRSGTALSTAKIALDAYYIPASTEWRTDSINLAGYIGKKNILISFRAGSSPQNNVYLDDINLRKVIINPNLKEKGFLVTPNPARSNLAVQFYPQPADLKSINVYSVTGALVRQVHTGSTPANTYNINISSLAPGTYIVSAVFYGKVIQRRIIKVN